MMDRTEEERESPANTGALFISLHPNRSLSRSGFIILMSIVSGISFVTGLKFWSMGAWPVFGFFGLDVLLIYLMFHLNFRSARQYETINIDKDLFQITRVAPNGRSVTEEFEPYWARSLIDQGTLWITNRGRAYQIGNFLGEEEKIEVQELITRALDTYRKGGILQSPNPSTSIIS